MNDTLARHPVFAPGILSGFHLLEADAGTGKTWTISALAVRALVERKLDIDSVLVVSFTRAATAELSERIRSRIEQVARAIEHRLGECAEAPDDPFCRLYASQVADPQDALRRLRLALARVDEAQVRTIHGFCHRVITEHAMSIGLAPGLRAEALGTEWIERGLAAWWRESVAGLAPDALALLHACGVSPASLVAPVRAIDARPGARVVPAISNWRALPQAIVRGRERLGRALADEAEAFQRWVAVKGNAHGNKMRPDHVRTRLAALASFAAAELDANAAIPPAVAQFTGAYIACDGRYAVPDFELIAACEELDALRQDADRVAAVVAHEAAVELARRRLELKVGQGAIDHDDLLRVVRDALARPGSGVELAASLRARYPLALVDECQDTDAMQWEIFRRVYLPGESNAGAGAGPGASHGEGSHALVLVGDPKQSIYAFRSADVYSYLEARQADPACHALHENQRSVPALLEAINALFSRPLPFLVPEIGFSPARAGAKPRLAFRDRAQRERGAITVFEIGRDADAHDAAGDCDTREGGGGEGEGEGGESNEGGNAMIARAEGVRAALARTVAEISRLLAAGEVTLGERALAPGDIAVLVNSHLEGTLVKNALQAAGIGAAEISRDSVLESRECAELIRVIAAIATPADTGLVRGALATMLIDRPDLCADDAAAASLLGLLAEARASWAFAGPHAALRRLFGEVDAYRRLATIRDGERRLTNLAHLVELLGRAPEAREGAAPALRWLMRMRDDPQSLGADAVELRLESDENLVRISTVHKSKGLEYPIVFLPFAWNGREFSRPRANSRSGVHSAATAIHFHESPAVQASWRAVLDFESTKGSPQWEQASTEAYSESLRALYVAITRAQQRCYLAWGAVAGAQFAPLGWLLCGLDPRAQQAWKSNSKADAALTGELAGEALNQWRGRANAADAAALRVIAASQRLDTVVRTASAVDRARDQAPVARTFSARVPAAWIQTSFTALARMVGDHLGEAGAVVRALPELPDHDQSVVPESEEAESDDARFAFPGGALAGTCLHDILERAAFSRPIEVALVSDALARVGYRRVEPAGVARWLDEVVATPLASRDGDAVALCELDDASLVREMEFHLAAREVDTREVIDAIATEFPLDARVASQRWSGFLRGFIDLVYRVHGQWYLLDWKSNRLGARVEAYDQSAMARANAANAYPLQFCLYALALHRLLRARLPGYAYDEHFGGVRYVYLRGVSAQSAPAAGSTPGVYVARPSAQLIDTLDALFGGAR